MIVCNPLHQVSFQRFHCDTITTTGKDVAVAGVGIDAAIIGTDRTVKGTAKIATGVAATTGTYSFDEDCVFVAIDDSENEGAEGGIEAIPTAQKCLVSGTTQNYVANAIVVLKNDGTVATPNYKIVAVFYDVDNMLNRNTTTDAVVTDSHVHFAG